MNAKLAQWLPLAACLLIPLAGGGLISLFIGSSFSLYATLTLPPFSPPSYLFPIVWSILYLIMGYASYRIYRISGEKSRDALFHYGISLFVNFMWPILFFQLTAFLAAFVWLVFLWILVFRTIQDFWELDTAAGYLMIPVLTWIAYAGYLNFAVFLLNP